MATVRVAVRVRPMSQREKDLSSQSIIHMEGNKTSISNLKLPKGIAGYSARKRTRTFSYDFSYDSTDCESANFVSQEKIFKDLGSDVLLAAFQGYNACIFAYGQTGSGKSFTMMGSSEDRGLIPRICEGLFGRIAGMTLWDKASFCTKVSYLEIYNERIRDLLRKKSSLNYNLRVREHPKAGPYVEDLSKHLVQNYCDVEELMEMGNAKRTTASTVMNNISSRSHAIFTINFTQAKFGGEMPCETVSKIHLVDLAGSERAHNSGSSGVRLKEGGNINKSLVTLGNVISALADWSDDGVSPNMKKRHVFVPYRDSVLTWLLKDSLGGNSKTIMIATISPADLNYSETLSTLRYANRAKNIMNKPTINEDSNVKLIRELRAEIARLKVLLGQGSQIALLDSPTALSMEEKLHENEARVLELTKEWTNKWNETQNILKEETLALRKEGIGVVLDSELPHLIGIDEDLLSTGIILYHLKEGRTSVGRDDAEVQQDIVLHGPSLEREHCVFENLNDLVTLVPLGSSQCFVNGIPVMEPYQLSQGAVILLGRMNMFRFNHPKEAAKMREKRKSTLLSSPNSSMTDVSESSENLSSVMLYNPGRMECRRRQCEELETLAYERLEHEIYRSKQKMCDCRGGRRGCPLGAWETSGHSSPAIGPKSCVAGLSSFANDRLLSYIEGVPTRLQKLDEMNTDTNSKPSECLKEDEKSVCDTNPLKLTDENYEELPHGIQYLQAVISSNEISRVDRKTAEGFVKKLSPEESDCVNHLEKGHLCKEGEMLRTAKTEKEVDVSPHKSGRLEMPAESPAEEKGHQACLRRERDRPENDVSQSATSSDGSGSNLSKSQSGTNAHPLTGNMDEELCGVTLLLLLSASQADGGTAANRTEVQETSEVPLPGQSLPRSPLVEMAVEGQLSDAGMRKVSTKGLVEPGQEAVSEHKIVQQYSGDDQNKSCDYKLARRLSCLFQGAGSRLRTTKRVIRQIVKKTHFHSWYKQMYMIVKHLSLCQNIHLKVTIKSDVGGTVQLPDTLRNFQNYIKHQSLLQPAQTMAWSHKSSLTISKDVQFFCQKLVQFPLCLHKLQSLTPQKLLACLGHLIPDTIPNSQMLLGVYWLHFANSHQPAPQPGCVLLFESIIYAIFHDRDLQGDKGLAVFHQLQLQRIREVHVGFAGQHVRVLGTTEHTIFTMYTYSKQLTQGLCQALLRGLSPEAEELSRRHPLLQGDLMELSLNWKAYIPDLCLNSRLRLSSQFKRALADLVYFLHGNMKEKPSLADVHLLLYTSVRVKVSPHPRPHAISWLLLTDTHVGLVQEDGVFHPTPRSITLMPKQAHFEQVALRELLDVRCVLVADRDSFITVDVVFKATRVRYQEFRQLGKNNMRAIPSLSEYYLFPFSEVWELTFGCRKEAAFVINHLSMV